MAILRREPAKTGHFQEKNEKMGELLKEVDLRLLDSLQRDNLQTVEQLAEQVGRSTSAVARRVRRLRNAGMIAADIAVLSEKAAGHPLFAIVQVQLERHSPQASDLFQRTVLASPNVQLAFDVSGTFDILLVLVSSDMRHYNEIARVLLEEQPAVRRFETSFVKRRTKASLVIPLDILITTR